MKDANGRNLNREREENHAQQGAPDLRGHWGLRQIGPR
jgi:hypothetical protein